MNAKSTVTKTEVESKSNETTQESTSEATSLTGPIVALLDADKVKSIRAKLGDRTYFITDESGSAFEKAQKHIDKISAETDGFFGLPVFAQDGIDSADYITIATLGTRDKGDSAAGVKARNGYKAIMAFSVPTVADFLADESDTAKQFVAKLIERETADVAFQTLRQAETYQQLETAFTGMPKTVSDIATTSRESGGGMTEAFDAMWPSFRAGVLKVKVPKVEAALPQKPEIIKAIRSKSYAVANPKTVVLEQAGVFEKIIKQMIALAPGFKDKEGNPQDIDTANMQDWLDNRESLNIGYSEAVVTSLDELGGIDF